MPDIGAELSGRHVTSTNVFAHRAAPVLRALIGGLSLLWMEPLSELRVRVHKRVLDLAVPKGAGHDDPRSVRRH